jgi:FSR family fosmidomycin resistance protein-like MFS transporter
VITKESSAASARGASGLDRKRLALLALGHAITDSYGSSFLSPLLPLLAARLGLTMAMVGSLPMVMGLSGSLGQPLLGYLTDRRSRLCLVALGPVVAAVSCGLVGHMPSYPWLLVCLFTTGLGIGAFHPQAASLAKRASGGGGLAMSAFTVGGNIGFGLAPLVSALALRTLGMGRLSWISLPGMLFGWHMWRVIGRDATRCSGVQVFRCSGELAQPGKHLNTRTPEHLNTRTPEHLNARRSLAFLTATVAVRATVQVGMTTFLPFYLITHALPGIGQAAARGLAVSAFLLANGLAGPLGGHLSDRLGRKRVMLWSFLLATPPLLLAFRIPGYGGLAALALGGAVLALPQPANVIMAQEMMPESVGIAASMITGFAWGIAMLLALPLGAAADYYGAGVVLRGLALLPLLGIPLVLPIPEAPQRSAISGQRSAQDALECGAGSRGQRRKADR